MPSRPRALLRHSGDPTTRSGPDNLANTACVGATSVARALPGTPMGFTGNAHRAQGRSYALTGAPPLPSTRRQCLPTGNRMPKPGVGNPPLVRTSNRLQGAGRFQALQSLNVRRTAHQRLCPQGVATTSPPRKNVNQSSDLTTSAQAKPPALPPSQSPKSTRRNPGAAFWHTACISSGETADSHTAAGRDAALGRTNGTGTS